MEATTLKLYSFNYKETRTYLLAILFVIGNILLPQLCHLIPNGGLIFLPIYFFTLIAAYKYGWKVGMLTAVMSPLINHVLFGMPPLHVLPIILVKSSLLALVAGFASHSFKRISISILIGVVLVYQVIGTLFEWIFVGDLRPAIHDLSIGIPGMVLQVAGGCFFIKYLIKN